MKEELESLKPTLEEKSKQVEDTMKILDVETKEVESIKEVVDREAAIVAERKAVAEGIIALDAGSWLSLQFQYRSVGGSGPGSGVDGFDGGL